MTRGLQQDNFDSAYAVMDRLPVEFKLKEKEVTEKDRTKQFISIVQGYRSSGRTDAELGGGELQSLRDLMENEYDHPAIWAQNLLCFGYGECRPPQTGGDGGAQAFRKPVVQEKKEIPALSVFPNPASVWATMAYDLKEAPDNAYLAVRDVTGKELARIPLGQMEGQNVWDTRSVAPGVYAIELVNNGATLGTTKLVVKQ